MPELLDEEPWQLFQRLGDMLRPRPPDSQPAQTQAGVGVDLHFYCFLQMIHKYATRLRLRFRATDIGTGGTEMNEVCFALDGHVDMRNKVYGFPSEHTFVLKLRTVYQWGVYEQQVKAFRTLFNLTDDKEFFQIFTDGKQV
jgi:hypothetical protein